MRARAVSFSDATNTSLQEYDGEQTVVLVAKGKEVIGLIQIDDETRADAKEMVTEVKKHNIHKTVMLTGDKKSVAKKIGDQIGVDEVAFDLLPSEKVEYIHKLKAQGLKVAMIGDGINDAPALATADVGIAMGLSGTDVVIETAGIVLATDDLKQIPKLLKITKETMKVIKQNITFAMVANILGVFLSIYGLIPPLTAAIIHESNALGVALNSLRLLKIE